MPIDFYLGSAGDEVTLEISSLEGKKHTAIVDGVAGVQQYRWNLMFDGPPLNGAQLGFIEQQLETMIEEWDVETMEEGDETREQLEARLAAFRDAADDPHRMKAIRGLDGVRVGGIGGGRGGFRGRGGRGGFGGWGEPAGSGEFLITMSAGEITQTTTLVVREDPIHQQ